MPSSGGAGGFAGFPYATKDTFSTSRFTPPDPDFVIAVLDTGVTVDGIHKAPHPYLAKNLLADWPDYPDPLEDFERDARYGGPGIGMTTGPQDGHGTFVAGRILHEAPFATLAMRNPLDGPTPPPVLENDHLIAEAIRGLKEVPNLKLVNLGSYTFLPEPNPPESIQEALTALLHDLPELMVVTSMSNTYRDEDVWPAAFNRFPFADGRIVAVGAVDESLTPYAGDWRTPPKASFSGWRGVDVWASGVDVLGPHLQQGVKLVSGDTASGWVRWSGSPFATATVTGMIARRMKLSEREKKKLTAREAFDALIEGRPLVDVPGVPSAGWKPWLRERGSRWPEYPGRPDVPTVPQVPTVPTAPVP